MPIPIRFALFDPETQRARIEQLHTLTAPTESLTFEGFSAPPILSINRGFTAPINVETDRSFADLSFLSAHDDDPFARYEALQQLMLDVLIDAVATGQSNQAAVIEAVRNTLADPDLEPALVGEALLLPSEAFIGDQMLIVDPEAIRTARENLRRALATALDDQWRSAFGRFSNTPFSISPAAQGGRRLKNVALGYIMASGSPDAGEIAYRQFSTADNMTDRQGALLTLGNSDADERPLALGDFYRRYQLQPLAIDKWFSAQAMSIRDDTPLCVAALRGHGDFTLTNPNRVRALLGGFTANQAAFHHLSGGGYRFAADTILELDKINPQIAAKHVVPLGRWKRFDVARQALMTAELNRILSSPGLSKDVYEQVSKSLT